MIVLRNENVERVVLLSDVHFGKHAASLEWVENMKSYFSEFFIPYLKEQKSLGETALVIAGDYFENRDHLDIMVMNAGVDVLESISAIVPVYMIVGNHDIYKKSANDINSLRVFRNLDNVTIVDRMATLEISGGIKMLLMAWMDDPKDQTKALRENTRGIDCVIMHSEISGMKMDNGQAIVDGVDCTVFKKAIFSGHIHSRQESKKITYIGSPYDMTRADVGNEKGIYTLYVEDGKLKKSFRVNDFSPRYVIVNYRIGTTVFDEKFYQTNIKNNYVYVKILSSEQMKIDMNAIVDDFVSHGSRGVAFLVEHDTKAVLNESVNEVECGDDIKTVFSETLSGMDDVLSDDDMKRISEMNEGYLKRAAELLNEII